MAFTKIVSPGIDTTGSYTVQELNTVGVVTAATVQVGSATTVHTTGIDLGSGNITSHNINSTGIITATSFVGPVTGNITGDITAASGTFSGNVSIGGTLTYEDVTNIDVVGVLTARSDVSIADKIIHTDDIDTTIRFPAADTVAVETAGSERVRITSAGRVGVGTDLPDSMLHIKAGNDRSAITLENTFDNPNNVWELNPSISGSSNTGFCIRDVTDSANRFIIDGIGRVGIGTDNPGAILSLPAGESNTPRFAIESAVDDNDFTITQYEDGNGTYTMLGQNVKLDSSGNNTILDSGHRTAGILLDARNHGAITFLTGGTNAVTEPVKISSDGKVGIGTNNPEEILHVFAASELVNSRDGVMFSSNSSPAVDQGLPLVFTSNIGGGFKTYGLASIAGRKETSTVDGSDAAGYLQFSTTNTSGTLAEKLRITSAGNVGIGTDAYGNVAPLAPLHVSSYSPTTAITDHGTLRSASQLLLQTSNNVNDSKSGVMFSGALHSTDGCSAGIIANHENVAENSETTSLSFYTSHNESLKESLKITSDSQFETNGVRNIYQTFLLVNNATYDWDFTVPNEGGYGNSFYLVAGYNHYYTTSYGAHRTVFFSTRGTSVNAMGSGIEQYHSQSGSWTFSKPNATTVRITKTGGTYGGSGYGFFHLMYNNF